MDSRDEGVVGTGPCLSPVLGRPLAGWGPKYLGGGVIPAGVVRGLGRFPSREFSINAAWLTVTMIAVDLLAWTQHVLLYDQLDLAKAEPKTIRYRFLHVAARIVKVAPADGCGSIKPGHGRPL